MKILRRENIEKQNRSDGRTVQKFLSHEFSVPIEKMALYLCDVPGGKFDDHYHTDATEVICFPQGGKITINETTYDMSEWDMVVLEPGDVHGYDGESCDDILHLAVKMPNSDYKVKIGN